MLERFLRYTAVDTQSDPHSGTHPSTQSQKALGRMLCRELTEMGAEDIYYDREFNYVYGFIPATDNGRYKKTIAFIAHMDTSPETTGKDVKPRIIKNYNGKDIILDNSQNIVLSPEDFPELLLYKGDTLITTDGNTLLGADDKAGIAEIMEMAKCLLADAKRPAPEYIHGRIGICFTTDEEIGEGVLNIKLDRLKSDAAYTVDGGRIGEIQYENFNAASADIIITGRNIHPGDAKNKMINAASIASEIHGFLPQHMRPEETENYEGFFHLLEMSGNVEKAEMHYLIRDHDRKLFNEKKQLLNDIVTRLNERHGNVIKLTLKDSYYNMKEKIYPKYMYLVRAADEEMKKLGIEPLVLPIRGGTDGANLSYMGLPCPNLCAGGHNFHGRYEYISLESMEKISKLLTALACDMYLYDE